MVEKAQQMKLAGHSAKEIIDWLNHAAESHKSFLIPQDFNFLRRGGRLTPMAATLGSVLKLKPVMTQTEDGKKLEKFAVKRTMKSAVQEIINYMKEKKGGSLHEIVKNDVIFDVNHSYIEYEKLTNDEILALMKAGKTI